MTWSGCVQYMVSTPLVQRAWRKALVRESRGEKKKKKKRAEEYCSTFYQKVRWHGISMNHIEPPTCFTFIGLQLCLQTIVYYASHVSPAAKYVVLESSSVTALYVATTEVICLNVDSVCCCHLIPRSHSLMPFCI